MTKPKNFPERQRQRRMRALERLEHLAEPPRKRGETGEDFVARKPAWRAARDAEIGVLTERTIVLGSQRDVRTKKYRGTGREYERDRKATT